MKNLHRGRSRFFMRMSLDKDSMRREEEINMLRMNHTHKSII